MQAHRRCLRGGLMACVLAGASLGGSWAYGQGTFLERLEATVRERLAAPNNQPPSGASSAEELPSPPGAAIAPSAPPSGTTSVLEGRSSSPASAEQPLQPQPSEGSPAGSAPPPASRIYLGLEAEEVTGGGIGVRVTKVTEASPAWKAGFRTGDRIAAINGFAIANLDSMVEQLAKTAPGETVKFLVNRNERNMELVAVLMDANLASRIARGPLAIGQQAGPNSLPANRIPPDSTLANDLTADDASLSGAPWLGVMVNDLTPEFRQQFGLSVFRGAAVTSVAASSPASQIGMLAGDAIIAVAGTPIESARDLMVWMSTARPGQTLEITYQRGTTARTAALTLEVTPESRAQRAANRAPLSAPARSRPDSSSASAGAPASPVPEAATPGLLDLTASTPSIAIPGGTNIVPNAIPSPVAPAADQAAEQDGSATELAELRREVDRLRSELEKANLRLETTQNRLQQILEGLGKE